MKDVKNDVPENEGKRKGNAPGQAEEQNPAGTTSNADTGQDLTEDGKVPTHPDSDEGKDQGSPEGRDALVSDPEMPQDSLKANGSKHNGSGDPPATSQNDEAGGAHDAQKETAASEAEEADLKGSGTDDGSVQEMDRDEKDTGAADQEGEQETSREATSLPEAEKKDEKEAAGEQATEPTRNEKTDDTGDDKKKDEPGAEGPQEPAGTAPGNGDDENRADASAEDPEDPKGSDRGTGDPQEEVKDVDYTTFSLDQLINTLTILVSDRPVNEIRQDVEHIKTSFYKKLKQETAQKKAQFLKEGGAPEDFQPGPDPREERLKTLLNQFKKRKASLNKELEAQKQANLEEKYRIIEAIEGLINKKESINKTFQDFRELQNQWHSVGPVPQSSLKHLWENYHYHVEKFYDYIKINKELRDLDLKKNMEAKMALCEKAEELLLEPNVVNAFKILQKYHDQWREIGPVPRESKDDLWERFRSATSKVNKRHQKHFEDLKAALKKNLEEKTRLCEQVEEILTQEIKTHKDWEVKSRDVIGIQKVWKTIGFAPKKHNTLIYERFRKACDAFFENKRAFYAENKEIQQNNLQLKTELCIQAEAMQESEEWKKTTEDLIQLQKKWKEIGPVPKKQSDAIWKRFRAACDRFFERKSDFYANIDQKYEENLKLKQDLIKEMESHQFGDDMDQNVKHLQEFQRRWAEIGFVPIKEKNAITQSYRNAINELIDRLKLDDGKVNLLKFKTKLEGMATTGKTRSKLESEREKFMNKIKKLESDIGVWENNIGFFAKSESADSMIREFKHKIEQAKKNIKVLDEKVRMIDDVT